LERESLLREAHGHDTEFPLSADSSRTRQNSETSSIAQEPSVEWDQYETSPSYFDNAFYEFHDDEYPETVEYGRVYDFSHLSLLPIHITSPPDPHQNTQSTPKKESQNRRSPF